MDIIKERLEDTDHQFIAKKPRINLPGFKAITLQNGEWLTKGWGVFVATFFFSLFVFFLLGKTVIPKQQIFHPGVNVLQTATPVSSKKAAENEFLIPQNTQPAKMTDVSFQTQSNMTVLNFLLSQNVLYQLSENHTTKQITLLLENTQLATKLPVFDYTESAIQNMKIINLPNGNLKILVSLKPNAQLQNLGYDEQNRAPVMHINFFKIKE